MTSRAQGNIVVQACCCAILASFQVRLRQCRQKRSLIFDPSESVGVMSCVRVTTLFQSKTISIFTWVPITFAAYPWKHTTQPQSENPHRNSSALQLVVGFSGGDKWWQELDHRFIRGPILLPTLRRVVAGQWSSSTRCVGNSLGAKRCLAKKLLKRSTKNG